MSKKVYVIGVGMTKFEKPGKRDWDYPDMAKEAGSKALADAGIDYKEVKQAVVGYVYGDSTCMYFGFNPPLYEIAYPTQQVGKELYTH
jgi:acetyl-CoA acetyltransferase